MPLGATKGRRWRFEELIAASGIQVASLTPADAVGLITRFFRGEFVEGTMLFAWWGSVDRSGEETFGLSMSIMFDASAGDSASSLSLLFKIGPRSFFGDFPGEKLRWCPTPGDIPAFHSGIENSAPFQVWGRSQATEVSLVWQHRSEQAPEPPAQPGDRMTADEWRRSEDAVVMLKALRASWRGQEADLVELTHRYLLACCRAIWKLLPMAGSRGGVEVAERYVDGRASREEFFRAEWEAERDAFYLEPFEYEPEDEAPEAREARLQYKANRKAAIVTLVKEVEAMPPEELRRLVHLEASDDDISPRQLLADAAYFADSAMLYPGIRPRESVIQRHRKFLSAALLREIVGDSFQPEQQ